MTRITYDPAKDASNQLKHEVSLALANELEWDTLLCKPDACREYGEPRRIGYAIAGNRLYCVVFVDRPDDAATERRIISLRKANSREVKRYEANS
ncbi:BrnT family toxin [Rhodoferax sp.]|uniref:BrnT family toxin n=1 Tax=Rhodoferax sp. TaxID=50421 RepID=UPI00261974FF|nr:BrnT family toxin [Rhodoferax sp.]MDD2917680.1 BrnT family toxin [Rhodoferax sp.]